MRNKIVIVLCSLIALLILGSFFQLTPREFQVNNSKSPASTILVPSLRILLVGDIMMARGVAALTDQFGLAYPFTKIESLFSHSAWDFIYGNLEGPVRAEALPVAFHAMSFEYSPQISHFLAQLGFNILNLANNHVADQGKEAVLQTRDYLQKDGIIPLGDPNDCSLKYGFQKEPLVFLGANLVYQNKTCVLELIESITKLKKQNPSLFVIVTPHWGPEYQKEPDNFQKQTAHQLIEAGADLIVGHHPHVVQGIEEYQGKLIFYSLGNFVFDQYFSKETQEELALSLDYQPQQQIFTLIPLESQKSQLNFLEGTERQIFFDKLTQISSLSLRDEIQKGVIIRHN